MVDEKVDTLTSIKENLKRFLTQQALPERGKKPIAPGVPLLSKNTELGNQPLQTLRDRNISSGQKVGSST